MSKNHAKEYANLLDGEYVLVTHVMTTEASDIEKHHHLYRHYDYASVVDHKVTDRRDW
jgi:hypothetical protein